MSIPYLGEIRMFGFPRVPVGWLLCDGSLQSIAENNALFALLGTTYGGDGVTTFGLPDLRGRVPIHQGQGLGLSPRVIGQNGGQESVTLTTANLPQHSHQLYATSNLASANSPNNTVVPGQLTSGDTMYSAQTTTVSLLDSKAIAATGGSQPHENTMPTLTISFCIAINGVFPSQG